MPKLDRLPLIVVESLGGLLLEILQEGIYSELKVIVVSLGWFAAKFKQAVGVEFGLVVFLGVNRQVAGILVHSFVPEVYDDGFHWGSARHFDGLMLIHRWVGPFSLSMIAEARSVLDIQAEQWSKVVQIWANHTRASMAIALAVKA